MLTIICLPMNVQYFVYLWFDKNRRMFYIGSHSGSTTDGYVSSSRWLSGEVAYRPDEFTKRVLSYHPTNGAMIREEHRLLAMIKDYEFGTKYYNRRVGRKKGCIPCNKGIPMSEEQKCKISDSKRGRASPTRGRKMPHRSGECNVMANPTNRLKLSTKTTGRKMIIDDTGKRRWAYVGDLDHPG